MDELVIVSNIYPKPDSYPNPNVFSNEHLLILTYGIDVNKYVIIIFSLVYKYKFGSPNDESLNSHPLYSKGLQFYEVHEVINSSWIDELEKMNSVHPKHNKELFLEDLKHLIFTFHDSTFECVITENNIFKTEIKITDSKGDLLNILKNNSFFLTQQQKKQRTTKLRENVFFNVLL
jgi:hypothetical protein